MANNKDVTTTEAISQDTTKTNNTLTEESPADNVVKVSDNNSNIEETVNNTLTDLQKQMLNTDMASATTRRIVASAKASVPDVKVDTINHVNVDNQRRLIDEINDQAKQQLNNQIDYTVNNGVKELQRSEADAQRGFQTQYNQINTEEQKALDNQVLYAKARGDSGGIGQAQYGQIQNTAAVNRQAVRTEQQKLSTDVARQIAQLRSDGEFNRADKLLELSQNYLSQLLNLEQYAQQMNLSIDEFNAELGKWEAQWKLSVSQYLTSTELNAAQMTGAFSSGLPTLPNYNAMQERLAAMGQNLMNAGVTPSEDMLAAMGLTSDLYTQYYNALHPAVSYGGGGGGGLWWSGDAATDFAMQAAMRANEAGETLTARQAQLIQQYNDIGRRYDPYWEE